MKKILWIALITALMGLAPDLEATIVTSVNIADLASADVIFTGTCTGAERRQLPLPGGKGSIEVMTYTFSVPRSDVIKGNVPETFSFNQPLVKEVPSYKVGSEYTLCLATESAWGLRSTIGLSQGKFDMIRAADGKKQIVNGMGNKSLFKNLPQNRSITKAMTDARIAPDTPAAEGPLDYDKFVNIMKELSK